MENDTYSISTSKVMPILLPEVSRRLTTTKLMCVLNAFSVDYIFIRLSLWDLISDHDEFNVTLAKELGVAKVEFFSYPYWYIVCYVAKHHPEKIIDATKTEEAINRSIRQHIPIPTRE